MCCPTIPCFTDVIPQRVLVVVMIIICWMAGNSDLGAACTVSTRMTSFFSMNDCTCSLGICVCYPNACLTCDAFQNEKSLPFLHNWLGNENLTKLASSNGSILMLCLITYFLVELINFLITIYYMYCTYCCYVDHLYICLSVIYSNDHVNQHVTAAIFATMYLMCQLSVVSRLPLDTPETNLLLCSRAIS